MKKNLIVAALVAGAMSASVASADDGRINFVGEVTDSACTVTNSVTNPLTVTLGKVARTAFTGAGSTAAPTKFTIALTNCPDSVSSATVKFDGTADTNVSSVLALTAATGEDAVTAGGVGIQIMDKQNVVVPLHTASSAYALSEGANNLDFVARYYATAATVTAGQANSTSNFTIVYN